MRAVQTNTLVRSRPACVRITLVVLCTLCIVLISPMLVVMVIGVGVPMLLTYVYCVVPFHLCRQGLCGKGSCAGADKDDDERAAQPRSIQDIWNMHTFNAITSWCIVNVLMLTICRGNGKHGKHASTTYIGVGDD